MSIQLIMNGYVANLILFKSFSNAKPLFPGTFPFID